MHNGYTLFKSRLAHIKNQPKVFHRTNCELKNTKFLLANRNFAYLQTSIRSFYFSSKNLS